MNSLHGLRRPFDRRSYVIGTRVRAVIAIVSLALVIGVLLSGRNSTIARLVLAASGGSVFVVCSGSNRRLALGSCIVWLVLLGFVRRLLIPVTGWSVNDPLTLLGPAAAVVFLLLWPHDDVPERDPLTPYIVVLMLWCVAEVANPQQGTFVVGLKGLLFWLGPLLWFFVGKRLHGSDAIFLRRVVLWCLVPVLGLGMYHSFIGFFPFEYHWVGVGGIGPSIFIDGFKIRPFSTLGSPQEYGFFLVFALAILWPQVLKRGNPHRRAWTALFALTWMALLFQSTRTLMVLFFVMIFITTILWFRSAAVTFVMSALTVLIIFLGTLSSGPINLGNGPPWSFVNHTVNGLLNPNDSTLPLHKQIIKDAVHIGVQEPLGIGVGSSTIAAAKSGQTAKVSAENDIATTTASLGIPGGLFYLCLIFATFFTAIRRFVRTNSMFDLGTVGILIVFLTQWWATNMYCAYVLFWLTVGSLAAAEARERPWETVVPFRSQNLAYPHQRLDTAPSPTEET